MTNAELLELAAKAAGMTIDTHYVDGGASVWTGEPRNSDWMPNWNPLADDGDALRLAVKVGIGVSMPDKRFKDVRRAFLSDINVFSVTDKDPYAATRRAIVRAAAEIGRASEPCYFAEMGDAASLRLQGK